jgi:cysteine desulfurase
VFRAAPDAEILPIDRASDGIHDGEVDLAALKSALARPGRAIVAIQSINSETGINQMPSARTPATELVREAGGILLSDCSQSAGKFSLPDADMVVVSAHKLGGPVGIGALLVRDYALLEPSGGQERGYRAGTENLPAALGFAAALDTGGIDTWQISGFHFSAFRRELWRHGEVISRGGGCGHILAVASEKLSANALLVRLDAMGFAVSAGSACSSGSLKPSRVLAAFGVDPAVAKNTIRVSLGWSTTPEELDAFVDAWRELNA